MSEINLIGGFYKSKTLPWSAQDVVNWLPVKSLSGGTRSPYKLRGAPGLRPANITVQPPPPPPRWLLKIGELNELPALSQGIFSSPDGDDWSDTTPVAGGGSLEYPNLGFDGTVLVTSNGQTERIYSGDEGQTFSALYTGGPIPAAGGGRASKIGANWYRANISSRLSVSANSGATFAEGSSDNDSRIQDIVTGDDGRLIGIVEGAQTYVSDDDGATWSARPTLSPLGTPTGFMTIERIRKTGTLVATYIAGVPAVPENQGRISISRDNGETWDESEYRFGIPQGEGGSIVGLTEWGDGYIAAGTQSGKIAISRNDGQSFTTASFNFPTLMRGLSGDNQKLIACGDGGELWKTTDGATWTKLDTPYLEASILWVTKVP